MNFCGTAVDMFRTFRKGGQQVESLQRPAAPGLEPGVVRRVVKWKSVPKVKSTRSRNPSPAATADFCRQARRVRATFGHDPVRMHQQLKQLTFVTRLDPAPQPDDPLRVTRFGREEAPVDHVAEPKPTGWEDPEDAFPRYTLLDPDDAPVDDEDEYDHLPPDRAFRRVVEQTLIDCAGAALRYSERLTLLKEAERRGLPRFEANLIIASVENDAREFAEETTVPTESRSRVSVWMVFVTAQSVITAALWKLIGA